MKALGFIEVYGFVTAIEALDSSLKASNVSVVGIKKVKGGIVTVIVEGDVGSVNAAVCAGEASASRIGVVLSTHVIPKMDRECYDTLFSDMLGNQNVSSEEPVLQIFDDKKEIDGAIPKELNKPSKAKKKNS